MDIIGKKAHDPPELTDDEQDRIDRDLASPQFVSWSARKEVRHLRDVVKTLPYLASLLPMAEEAVRLVDEIDDGIEGWET